MRLVITQNVTADGAVEMLTDWFDPSDQDQELAAELRRQDESCDAVLLGRQTFEDFRGYWPEQTDDTTGVSDQLNRVTKYVVSATITDPQWRNSAVLAVVLTGSITLAHLLIAEVYGRRVPHVLLPGRTGHRAAVLSRGLRRPTDTGGCADLRQRRHLCRLSADRLARRLMWCRARQRRSWTRCWSSSRRGYFLRSISHATSAGPPMTRTNPMSWPAI